MKTRLLTVYGMSSSPSPTAPSPIPYELPLSHNTTRQGHSMLMSFCVV